MAKAKKYNQKKILWILISVLIIGAVVVVVGRNQGWLGKTDTGKSVETTKAKLKTITSLVSASGKIQPEVEVVISPDVSGEIIELPVREGDIVKKRDLLLRIKPDIYEAQIEQLQANLLATKARMEQTKASLIRSEASYKQQSSLFKKELISELEYLTAKSSYEADKASLKSSQYTVQNAEAQLSKAKKELDQTIIRSPMDGTVSKLNVEKGERVVGSMQMTGTEVMRIARLEQMEVQVKVNENDIVSVVPGDTAIIAVDAYPNRSFDGLVTEVANSAILSGTGTSEQVTDYDVKIRIISPHNIVNKADRSLIQTVSGETVKDKIPDFKPGMSSTVDIKTETVINVVAVPIQAVTVRDFSKIKSDKKDSLQTDRDESLLIPKEDLRRVIFKVKEGIVEVVEVETGISDDTHIQILNGVDAGEEIVIGPYKMISRELKNKDKVDTENNKFNVKKVDA